MKPIKQQQHYSTIQQTASLLHPYSWLEIDQHAIEHNITQYKQIIGNNMLAVIIKGNAYGHDLIQMATICEHNTLIDLLGVTNLSDALSIRKKGITKNILIMSRINADLIDAVHNNIDFMVDDLDLAKQLNTIGKQHQYRFNIHVKVDTGLSRQGISPHETHTFIKALSKLEYIYLRGIFSHFSQAQEADLSFTKQQYKAFTALLNNLEKSSITIPLRHMSNSSSITALEPSPVYNLFRIGLGAYGLWPSEANKIATLRQYPSFNLKPALCWKTRIMRIKTVPAGSFISYNRTFQAPQQMKIAILPIGYADGYDTRYSNKTSVWIHHSPASVIGLVCMNMTIVDITAIKQASVGDEVILLGKYPPVTAYSLASAAHIGNVREVITTINPLLPRTIV